MKTKQWARETRLFWRESATPTDFAKIMRVRLAQSKIGRWVTPKPITVDVDLRTLGDRLRLRSHTTDISVLKEIAFSQALGHLPGTASTVVDLGANTGLSYRWLRSVYPSARFVCVEPEAGNVAILRANADERCQIVPACIGARERTVGLDSSLGEWGFQMVEGGNDVPVVTMDRLLADTGIDRIDVLKCDIEGAERELFEECRSWIGHVKWMTVECHLGSLDAETLMQLLADNGARFELEHLELNHAWGFELATLRCVSIGSGEPSRDLRTSAVI